MSGEITPFADNWAFIRAELGWLDRVLMRALARQRQLNQASDRVSKSPKDKATSHWWLGFIDLDPAKGGSVIKTEQSSPPSPVYPLGRYGDRLELNAKQDTPIGLIKLMQRCRLGQFERNLIVLCLAPEISRRYENLYALLNNDQENCPQPTVDLALRLFCGSDLDWRNARQTLISTAPMLKHKIIQIYPGSSGAKSLLSQKISLQPKFVNFLLSDRMEIERVIAKSRAKSTTKSQANAPSASLSPTP
jgi:hypothetical protein